MMEPWNYGARMEFEMSQSMSQAWTYFFYVFINIKSIILPSFTFTQADLAAWQCKLGIGVHDGTLKLGRSHVT